MAEAFVGRDIGCCRGELKLYTLEQPLIVAGVGTAKRDIGFPLGRQILVGCGLHVLRLETGRRGEKQRRGVRVSQLESGSGGMYLAALSDGLKDTAKLDSHFAFELLTFSGRDRLAFDCNSV